jgi:protein-disulfide isomerase
MKPDNLEVEPKHIHKKYGLVTSILIAGWLVAMSIIGAGLLISKEIAKQQPQVSSGPDLIDQAIRTPIEVKLPDNPTELGNPDAKVTVIEFADFQCPFCGQWQKEIYPSFKSNYIDNGKIRFVFWNYAFLGEESYKAAEAALCAKDQNKFWDFHDQLYAQQKDENKGTFSDSNLKNLAQKLGLDTSSFNSCFDKRIYKSTVESETARGVELGVASTPTLYINGLKYEGLLKWENYKQAIETELAK